MYQYAKLLTKENGALYHETAVLTSIAHYTKASKPYISTKCTPRSSEQILEVTFRNHEGTG